MCPRKDPTLAQRVYLIVIVLLVRVPPCELVNVHFVWGPHRYLGLHDRDHLLLCGLVLHELVGLLDERIPQVRW